MAEKDVERDKKSDPAPVITDQERDWAQTALADFNKGNYISCLQLLTKLESARPFDIKVLHNKAIAEYYKCELKKTDQFRKNMNIVCGKARINMEDLDSLEDVEHCVIYYNQAVLLYHMKQYNTALKIMDKIFSFIEPMEESLAHRVCLLLIELHLCTYQPEKALSLIVYIENQFVSTETVITAEKDMKPLEKEHKDEKPVSVDAATDAFRLKLLQYRARSYLLIHSLKACKRELKNIISSGGSNIASVYLKANLEYLRGNYRKAIKVLSSASQNSFSFKDIGESPGVLFYNNMGCIHHYMGKPNLACFYLQKALVEHKSITPQISKQEPGEPNSGRPLFTLGSSKLQEINFNIGVAMLFSGKPKEAFECLLAAVKVYHLNPRIWLRLAECCIMTHKADNETDFNFHLRKKDLVQGIIGSGIHKKIILTSQLNKDTKFANEEQAGAIPVPSIEFASLCLRNALFLLPPVKSEDPLPLSADSQDITPPPALPKRQYAAPSSPVSLHEVENLKCSILAACAYVNLCLGDYVIALEYAQTLLTQSVLSGVHRMLAHLYCAEALIMMDKISDAIEHLNPENAKDLSFNFPIIDKEQEKEKPDIPIDQLKPLKAWYPNNLASARAVFQYNLAVAFAIRGELDKAGETLKQLWLAKGPSGEIPIHVIMLALYIELQLGHAELARNLVKQNAPQCR